MRFSHSTGARNHTVLTVGQPPVGLCLHSPKRKYIMSFLRWFLARPRLHSTGHESKQLMSEIIERTIDHLYFRVECINNISLA